MKARRSSVHEAIDRLAALYPLGALTVCTTPARFIDDVADDVRSLRSEHAEMLALLREIVDDDYLAKGRPIRTLIESTVARIDGANKDLAGS